ncbi:hypothetical protein V1505DRAFT_388385 [Lipomyces doorenjongii]
MSEVHVPALAYKIREKKIVLHIGDPIKYDSAKYAELFKDFEVIRPSAEQREREPFMKSLKENKWGHLHATLRPYWNTGGDMGGNDFISLVVVVLWTPKHSLMLWNRVTFFAAGLDVFENELYVHPRLIENKKYVT